MDEVTLGLNGLYVKVLLEVDLKFPLKQVLIVSKDEECQLFEVCFYCERMRYDGYVCPEV